MSPPLDAALLQQAVQRLRDGGLVAFPTETVYGLGADARNPSAVERIYSAKGRPSSHPVIVHLAPQSDPGAWVSAMPAVARALIARFWPGPLTLILKRASSVPATAAGGQDSIGLRCPAHPLAQALLSAFADGAPDSGVAAPSANRFGHVSPTTAQHVRDEFGADGQVMILDGGACPVGIESTILDLSRLDSVGPVLLRPGSITPLMLADVLGSLPAAPDAAAPRASGTLAAHYAPGTPLRLVSATELRTAPPDVAVWAYSQPAPTGHPLWWTAPADAATYAHELYAMLRMLDTTGANFIWLEAPPQGEMWDGINDRLRRAALGSGHVT